MNTWGHEQLTFFVNVRLLIYLPSFLFSLLLRFFFPCELFLSLAVYWLFLIGSRKFLIESRKYKHRLTRSKSPYSYSAWSPNIHYNKNFKIVILDFYKNLYFCSCFVEIFITLNIFLESHVQFALCVNLKLWVICTH